MRANDALSNQLMRFSYWVVTRLQRFWTWWQTVPKPRNPLSAMQWLILVYAIFVTLFILVTPPLEPADEADHISRVLDVRQGAIFATPQPSQTLKPIDILPPAYYVIASALTSPFSFDDIDAYTTTNPYFDPNPQTTNNFNRYLRPPETPTSATPLYLLRAFNALIAGLSLLVMARIARLLAPQRPITPFVTVAILALNPMFLFLASSVNNVPLAILTNAVLIYIALRTLIYGLSTRWSIFFALALIPALLTDASAWLLLLTSLIGALWLSLRHKTWREFAVFLIASLTAIIIAGGGWLAHNLQTFADPFALTALWQTLGGSPPYLDLLNIFWAFQQFRFTFWGFFGAYNIIAPPFWYGFANMFVWIAVLGVIFLLLQLYAIRDFSYARRELKGLLGALTLFTVCLIALLIMTTQVQVIRGYWLFPVLGALAPLLAIGFVEIVWWLLFFASPPERAFVRAGDAVPQSIQTTTHAWLIAFVAIIVISLPLTVIAPAYTPPAPLDAPPTHAQITYIDYGTIELIAYEIPNRRYLPAETVPITLYWRTQEELPPPDLMLSLALINARGHEIAKIDTLPGGGRLPTSQWQPNAIYADAYELRLSPFVDIPQLFSAQVSWWDRANQQRLPAFTRAGQPTSAVLADLGAIVPSTLRYVLEDYIELPDERRPHAEWENQIKLLAFDYDTEAHELELFWEVMNPPFATFAVFAHIYDADGNLVGQADIHPELPTLYWQHAEQYVTRHHLPIPDLSLPAGDYTIEVGWYDDTGRLNLPNPDQTDETPPPTRFIVFTYAINDAGSFVSDELEALRALRMGDATPEPDAQSE